ncbi:hypothetical protein [Paraburkholderia hospita]|uniref:hypothetical protein n=1 Tax=Paraburkholderia hospita TaxID=169430 RepID=UPI0008A74BCD|nr:hypothetical protein [Paraburkholderia hospita]SEI20999.1 hypothetical protein SAMN05192544_103888 [Paraburkholderia hospita]
MGRLAAWQKVGIVLSIAWATGAAVHTHNRDLQDAQSSASYAYHVCADSKDLAHSADLSECGKEKSDAVAMSMQGDTADAAIVALAPLPFAWIFAYVLIGLGRALAIGLPVVLPWKSMSRPRKVFVVAGGLVSVGTALFGLTYLMGLYVDTRVPVSPGPSKAIVIDQGDSVIAEGTWTREGPLGDGSKLGDPLQTSKITCTKADNRCAEARAEITGEGTNVLLVDQMDYDIESWTPTTIVFVNETPCIRETYTIDRQTHSVNGVGINLHSDAKMCNMRVTAETTEDRWEYHLGDGFKVYWDLHQKARPALLRIVQAFFGN